MMKLEIRSGVEEGLEAQVPVPALLTRREWTRCLVQNPARPPATWEESPGGDCSRKVPGPDIFGRIVLSPGRCWFYLKYFFLTSIQWLWLKSNNVCVSLSTLENSVLFALHESSNCLPCRLFQELLFQPPEQHKQGP